MSGDQEKFHFWLNWSHSSHFRFYFSLCENSFSEFDTLEYAQLNYFFELLHIFFFGLKGNNQIENGVYRKRTCCKQTVAALANFLSVSFELYSFFL